MDAREPGAFDAMKTTRRIRLPRYTEEGRYPYHFCCTQILPARKLFGGEAWLHERTHDCWCSAWQQQADGTFLHWRNGKWMPPKKGDIKSKPIQ